MEDENVYFLFPPPHLHIGILGPGNDATKNIEKHVQLTNFKKKYNLRGSGPGGDMNGPQLKYLISNRNGQLDGFESLVKQKSMDLGLFIDHMRYLNKLNE